MWDDDFLVNIFFLVDGVEFNNDQPTRSTFINLTTNSWYKVDDTVKLFKCLKTGTAVHSNSFASAFEGIEFTSSGLQVQQFALFFHIRMLFFRPRLKILILEFLFLLLLLIINSSSWHFRFRLYWGFNYQCSCRLVKGIILLRLS